MAGGSPSKASAERLAELAALAGAGVSKGAAARQLGVATAWVGKWGRRLGLVFAPASSRPSPVEALLRARLPDMAAAGMTVMETARALGVSGPCVGRWARRLGIAFPSRAEALRRAWSDAARQAARDRPRPWTGPVPGWVPTCLAGEYREIAALEDEFAAARHVRGLKREMERPVP